jgi:hypothetical protein
MFILLFSVQFSVPVLVTRKFICDTAFLNSEEEILYKAAASNISA